MPGSTTSHDDAFLQYQADFFFDPDHHEAAVPIPPWIASILASAGMTDPPVFPFPNFALQSFALVANFPVDSDLLTHFQESGVVWPVGAIHASAYPQPPDHQGLAVFVIIPQVAGTSQANLAALNSLIGQAGFSGVVPSATWVERGITNYDAPDSVWNVPDIFGEMPPPPPPPAPTVSISVTDTTPNNGTPVTISWSVSGSGITSVSDPFGGSSLSGSRVVTGTDESRIYTVSATNGSGTTSDGLVVTWAPAPPPPPPPPAPTVSISVNDISPDNGVSVTIIWNVSGTDITSVTDPFGGSSLSGSMPVTGTDETVTYNVSATNAGGTSTDSVTVTWIPPPPVDWQTQYTVAHTPIVLTPKWHRQYTVDHPPIVLEPKWQTQYTLVHAPIVYTPDWQTQYTVAHAPIAYTPDWTEQYAVPHAPIVYTFRWQVQYRIYFTSRWTEQFALLHAPIVIVDWQQQYALDTFIAPADWQLQYTIQHFVGVFDWQQQYVFSDWRQQYVIIKWQQQYVFSKWRQQYVISNWQTQYHILNWQRQYSIPNWLRQYVIPQWRQQYAFSDWRQQYDLEVFIDGEIPMVVANIRWTDVLRYAVKWGRSEAAFGAICQPLQGQLILDNTAGTYDDPALQPHQKVPLIHTTEDGIAYHIATGWISDVRHLTDHATGLRTTTVHIAGVLQQLARADYELSLFITDTVRTGEIINAVLDHVNRPDIERDVDVGQVRIHPAHYTSVLTPRKLNNAMSVIRETETAEVGYVHEKRGDTVTFNDRFHREVDEVFPRHSFGATAGTIQIEGKVEPDYNWDNIYTVVEAGAERAVVQAVDRVYTLGGKDGGAGTDKMWPIAAGATVRFVCDLVNDVHSREHNSVTSVARWAGPDHVTESDIPGLEFLYSYTRTKAVVTIHNPTSSVITLTKLELHGTGMALYGDLTLPPIEAPLDIINRYGRRSLNLPVSFIGDGNNYGGDAAAEGRAFAEMLLLRYARPIVTGRLSFYPFQSSDAINAFTSLAIGESVTVTHGTGMPAGVYYVEGGEIQFDAQTGDAGTVMIATVSRRGRKFNVKNTVIDVVPPDTVWRSIGSGRSLLANRVYIVGGQGQFPAGTVRSTDKDDTVLRIQVNGETIKEWAEQDFPAQSEIGEFVGALINADANTGEPVIEIRKAPGSANILHMVRSSIYRVDS